MAVATGVAGLLFVSGEQAHLSNAKARAPRAATPSFGDGDGLHIVSVRQIDPRLVALVVKTAALPDPANVYILFPPGYASHPRRRYPVLYLLHGTSGTASDWTAMGDAEEVIGGRQLITVMPDIALNDGGGGWCTDWPAGAQRWETFHIDQLIPWLDANLRTIPTRAERAIAGLSQGGFCSLSYAARHPDLFSVALGYSGAPDIWYDPDARVGAEAIINATEVGLDGVAPNTFFGDPATDGINWAAHDPATLAENLRWTKLYMYWGNGEPGPYDTGAPNPEAMFIEGAIWRDNNDFAARLQSLQIPALEDDYGPGTHSWRYWTRDLEWSIDLVTADFAHPAPGPASVTYTSAEDRYSVYGWSVTTHRTAREFSTLENAAARGFALAGSGSATVLTPAVYVRGGRYRVGISGDQVRARALTLYARSDRRLLVEVPLGPANPYQEYTAQAQASGTNVYTTTVRIVRVYR
jgi:S-formylglutathione hydrolase FrmB